MTARRRLLWSGAGLLAAGAVVLGYVAWQLVGTTVVSDRKQDALAAQAEREWRHGAPAGQGVAGAVDLGNALALVRIPRFGDGYVVPVVQGVDDDALSTGLGHFTDSAGPGRVGNFALAGHRITHGEPLRNVSELRPGDTVVVETAHRVLTYRIDTDPADLEVDHADTWVVAPRPVNPVRGGAAPAHASRLITLVTCADLFHSDRRTVVFGHLVTTAVK